MRGKPLIFMLHPVEMTTGQAPWQRPIPIKPTGPLQASKEPRWRFDHLNQKSIFLKSEPVETRWIGSPHPFGKGKDILVYIREGYYTLEEPLVFNPEDGGERIETNLPTGAFEYHKLKDHYVTYAAYPGEKPVISGGMLIARLGKREEDTGRSGIWMLLYRCW